MPGRGRWWCLGVVVGIEVAVRACVVGFFMTGLLVG